MSIPLSKYVQITSGVGGSTQVNTRQYIGNIFTTNTMVDPLVPLTFSGGPLAALQQISNYFGPTSEEYLRAVFYFGYMSPAIRQPQAIMFSRHVPAASPCSIFGLKGSYVYTAFTSISAGVLKFNFNGTIVEVTSISLTGATTLATVASILQTALRLNASPYLTTCTVTYDAVAARFTFAASNSGVTTGTFAMVQDGTVGTTDLAAALGWYSSQGAAIISSSAVITALQAFTNMEIISNNFGTFCFTYATALTLSDWTAIATYNATLNVMFQFCIPVTASNYVATSAALKTIAGVGMTYQLTQDYSEMIPMAILASIDYNARNGATNFMYRQMPNVLASVIDPTVQTALDTALVNYYGQTMQAGQLISFYQNGVLTGTATSPQFMNIFANEQWFKDYVAAQILSLQLAMPEVSAGQIGRGQLLTIIQSAINLALFNGTIATGKTFTTIQQLYITNMTGDSLAWLQVQAQGYWMDIQIAPQLDPVSNLTVYVASYTVIYSKNDAVKSVSGTHILI